MRTQVVVSIIIALALTAGARTVFGQEQAPQEAVQPQDQPPRAFPDPDLARKRPAPPPFVRGARSIPSAAPAADSGQMIVTPADADDFRELVETTIPPRYNRGLIKWFAGIFQRQQAAVAEEMKKKADQEKAEQEKTLPR